MAKKKRDIEEIVGARIVDNHIMLALAKSNHMSQTEFAARVGISYRHSNRIIANTSEPSYVTAVKMGLVLNVDPQELFDVEVKQRRVSRSKAMVVSA